MRFAGCGIQSPWPIFKTEMLICQPKAKFEVKILFGASTHLVVPEIRKMGKMTVESLYGKANSTSDFIGP